jgi:hypothetical protein
VEYITDTQPLHNLPFDPLIAGGRVLTCCSRRVRSSRRSPTLALAPSPLLPLLLLLLLLLLLPPAPGASCSHCMSQYCTHDSANMMSALRISPERGSTLLGPMAYVACSDGAHVMELLRTGQISPLPVCRLPVFNSNATWLLGFNKTTLLWILTTPSKEQDPNQPPVRETGSGKTSPVADVTCSVVGRPRNIGWVQRLHHRPVPARRVECAVPCLRGGGAAVNPFSTSEHAQ